MTVYRNSGKILVDGLGLATSVSLRQYASADRKKGVSVQGISKRVAFLDYLDKQDKFVSAREAGEGVRLTFGKDYDTETAERNGILNSLVRERLVRFRRIKPTERYTKQQRFVFTTTTLGSKVAEGVRQNAAVLLGKAA